MTKVLFLVFFPVLLFGQTYSGKIIDEKTKSPVLYANIGVLNQSIGTVSNENGNFKLNLTTKVKNTDTIRVSMIGFEMKDYIVKDFKKAFANGGQLTLIAKDYKLDEVTIIPKDYKTLLVGNTKRMDNMSIKFDANDMGQEMAVQIKIKKRRTLIDKVFVNINECTYDSIFYRLNIYEYDKKAKLPGKNVLPKPVYINLAKEEIDKTIEVDISHLNVLVQDDFVISLEFVKDLGEGELALSANFMKSKGLARETSQGKWITVPIKFGPSISAEIRQEQK
jgi:hypothetical protein